MKPSVSINDEFKAFQYISTEFDKRIPLKNLNWINSNNIQRNIPLLDIQIVPFSSDIFPKTMPINSHISQYFLHIFCFACEDVDFYKNNVRKQIQDWLSVLGKRNQEYLIIYIIDAPSPASSVMAVDSKTTKNLARFFGGSVFDKVKSDYNGKSSRCFQVKSTCNDKDSIEQWDSLFARIKESIISSFNTQILGFEEDARKLDAQRLFPGWNYCQYFIMKEKLAYVYDLIGLHHEALVQYDELEAQFFQSLTEQGAHSFQKFGGTDNLDDSLSIASSRKPYRDLILQNQITIFDFRIYLFSRQMELLFKSIDSCFKVNQMFPNNSFGLSVYQRLHQVTKRCKIFTTTFARTIREYDVSLSPFFAESWIYSCCENILTQCEIILSKEEISTINQVLSKVVNPSENPHASQLLDMVYLFEGARADLFYYSRIQLDTLGCVSKLIPFTMNTSPLFMKKRGNLPSGATEIEIEQNTPSFYITNATLKKALSSIECFDFLYKDISGKAFKSFDSAKRFRMVRLLKCEIAFLEFHRRKYAECKQILESVVNNYKSELWITLLVPILDKLAQCYRNTDDKNNFVRSVLELLCNHERFGDATMYLEELCKLSTSIDNYIQKDSKSYFEVKVLDLINKVGDDEGSVIQVECKSLLPSTITVDSFKVSLLGGEKNEVWFFKSHVELKPGFNSIRLVAERTSFPGNYSPERLIVSLGKIIFSTALHHRTHDSDSIKHQLAVNIDLTILNKIWRYQKKQFRIGQVSNCLYVSVGLPVEWNIEETISHLVLQIHAKQHAIINGCMTLTSLTGLKLSPSEIEFTIKNSSTGRHMKVTQTKCDNDGNISVPTCSEEEMIEFKVPCVEFKNGEDAFVHKIKVVMFYSSSDGTKRLYNAVEKVKMACPVSFDHKLFTLVDKSLIKINVSGKDTIPIRIVSATMNTNGPNCKSLSDVNKTTHLFENQEFSFVYQILKSPAGLDDFLITFTLKYFSVSDEIQSYIISLLAQHLAASTPTSHTIISKYTGLINQFFRHRVFPKLDYVSYAMRGVLTIPPLDFTWLETQILDSEDELVKGDILKFLNNFHQRIKSLSADLVVDDNSLFQPKTLFYQFTAVEQKTHIVTDLLMNPKNESLMNIGEYISCELVVSPPKNYVADNQELLKLVCELTFDEKYWVVSGKVKLLLSFENNEPLRFPFIIIPLKAGYIPYPKVVIEPTEDCPSTYIPITSTYLKAKTQISVIPISESQKILIKGRGE